MEGVGPALNYGGQVGPVKVLLGLFMLLGRLELYAILVLLAPRFWRGE
jgi:Trk-type K+ transport system membrane component